jgi:hypothetical protein
LKATINGSTQTFKLTNIPLITTNSNETITVDFFRGTVVSNIRKSMLPYMEGSFIYIASNEKAYCELEAQTIIIESDKTDQPETPEAPDTPETPETEGEPSEAPEASETSLLAEEESSPLDSWATMNLEFIYL